MAAKRKPKNEQPILDADELLEQVRAILEKKPSSKIRAIQPVEVRLDRIFELQGTENEVAKDLDQMIEKLQEHRKALVAPIVEERERLSVEVKSECLEMKQSIAGKYLQVVWSEGTRSWNSDGLEDFAKSHPEVLNFRKQSAPVAKIIQVKKERKK